MGRCLGVGTVVGLSEGGIVVVGGNVVVKALGGKVNVVVCMCGNVVVGGIVMAVGDGNVAVSLGLGGTVVANVIDVVCPFCLCCVLAGVVDPDLLLGSLRSLTKLTSFPCETFTIASKMDLANFSHSLLQQDGGNQKNNISLPTAHQDRSNLYQASNNARF